MADMRETVQKALAERLRAELHQHCLVREADIYRIHVLDGRPAHANPKTTVRWTTMTIGIEADGISLHHNGHTDYFEWATVDLDAIVTIVRHATRSHIAER